MPVNDINPLPELTPDDITRFTKRVPQGLPEDICWPWLGSRLQKGLPYGRFYLRGKTRQAHRIAYAIKYGQAPATTLILHACDNPPCVNWQHLFKGTHKDNTEDMYRKDRFRGGITKGHSSVVGESNQKAKLTEEQVRQIRELWTKEGTKAARQKLADEFSVSLTTVYRVANGYGWTHIK